MTWSDRHPEGSLLEYLSNAPTGCRSTGLPRELNISIIIRIPTGDHFFFIQCFLFLLLRLILNKHPYIKKKLEVVDQWMRMMGRVRVRMRLGLAAIDDTVPWVFLSRQSWVVLVWLLALCSLVCMGINTSGIDWSGRSSTAFETSLILVCHLCIDVALAPVSLSPSPLCPRPRFRSLYPSLPPPRFSRFKLLCWNPTISEKIHEPITV